MKSNLSNLLITGGSGFVGSNLARFFARKYCVFLGYFQSPIPFDLLKITVPVQLDITDSSAINAVIENISPNVVIHAAGNKNVRHCEKHPEQAYQTNALGTRNVARACHRIGARMIYISTDLVFSCTDGDYQEEDHPKPNLVYGETKLQGEKFLIEELENAAICRSGGIYGKYSPLLQWLELELTKGHNVECFTDVFNTPTYTVNLAEMIESIIDNNQNGIFHTVGRERVNRFQFFHNFVSVFNFNIELLTPIQAGSLREKMLLQQDASLSISQTASILSDVNFNSIKEGLNRLKDAGGIS